MNQLWFFPSLIGNSDGQSPSALSLTYIQIAEVAGIGTTAVCTCHFCTSQKGKKSSVMNGNAYLSTINHVSFLVSPVLGK